MNLVIAFPPNYKQIKEKFNPPTGTVFTYGDTVYCPDSPKLSPDLLVHELTHINQQGNDPETWWNKYIEDPNFRLEQEVEAYREQYKKFCQLKKDRNIQARFLFYIAGELASATYGHLIGRDEAVRRIKQCYR